MAEVAGEDFQLRIPANQKGRQTLARADAACVPEDAAGATMRPKGGGGREFGGRPSASSLTRSSAPISRGCQLRGGVMRYESFKVFSMDRRPSDDGRPCQAGGRPFREVRNHQRAAVLRMPCSLLACAVMSCDRRTAGVDVVCAPPSLWRGQRSAKSKTLFGFCQKPGSPPFPSHPGRLTAYQGRCRTSIPCDP